MDRRPVSISPSTPSRIRPLTPDTHKRILLAPIAQFLVNLLFDGRLPLLQEPPFPLSHVGVKRSLAFPPRNLVRDVPIGRRLWEDVRLPPGDLVDKGLHEFFSVVVVGHDGRMTDKDRGRGDVAGRVGQRGDWREGRFGKNVEWRE